MAVGDVKSGLSLIAAGAYLSIQPGAGEEWVIHNVYHSSDISIELYDGATSCVFDTETGSGVYARYAFHVTNSIYLRVRNTTGVQMAIGYDGIQTK